MRANHPKARGATMAPTPEGLYAPRTNTVNDGAPLPLAQGVEFKL